MDKDMKEMFLRNAKIGFKCTNCGTIIIDGKKHKKQQDLCDKCKIPYLEQKLAESEEKYKKAYREGLLQKQFDKDMEISQLKQQLAEKEKEIEKYKNGKLVIFSPRQNGKSNLAIIQFNEWQNRVAIEQLNFLKNEIEIMGHIPNYITLPKRELICRFDVLNQIDNQIKQLKEGK